MTIAVLVPNLTLAEGLHGPGTVVIGGSIGYGMGSAQLKLTEGNQSTYQHNVTNGYLRGAFFVTPSVALGAQYQSWADQTNGNESMKMNMTAVTLSWYPTDGFYANLGVGLGELEAEFGLLQAADVPPGTPPDEMPPTQIVPTRISHDAAGVLLAGGYEWHMGGPLTMGFQADLWYLETLDNLTGLVSSFSVTANLYLW
jgi:hypothetical protein